MDTRTGHIYLTVNRLNYRKYIGKDVQKRNTYLGSGKVLKRAIAKYGRENFVKFILEECPIDELAEREIHWIKVFDTFNSKTGYNLTEGGEGLLGRKHTEETKEKIRELHRLGRYDEVNKSRIGRSLSDGTKVKIRESLLGRTYVVVDEDTKIKMIELFKQGESLVYISSVCGVGPKIVKRELIDNNIIDETCRLTNRRTGSKNYKYIAVDEDIKIKMIELFKQGKSLVYIGRVCKIGKWIVRRELVANGIIDGTQLLSQGRCGSENWRYVVVDDDTKDRMFESLKQGASTKDISRIYGIGASAVRRVLLESYPQAKEILTNRLLGKGDLNRFYKPVDEDTRVKVIELFKQDKSLNDISIVCGISSSLVKKVLIEDDPQAREVIKSKRLVYMDVDKDTTDKIMVLYRQDISIKKISKLCGISRRVVTRVIIDEDPQAKDALKNKHSGKGSLCPRYISVDEVTRDKMIELFKQGSTMKDISDLYGIKYHLVRREIKSWQKLSK